MESATVQTRRFGRVSAGALSLAIPAALALLTACGPSYSEKYEGLPGATGKQALGAPAVVPAPADAKPCALAEKRGRTVFVSDVGTNEIVCFSEKSGTLKAVGAITQGINMPFGVALDGNGRLYVANGAFKDVAVYAPGQAEPAQILGPGVVNPVGVAIDAQGAVYVSNSVPPSLVRFPKGKSVPSMIVKAKLVEPFGIAVDKAGTVFVADYGAGHVLTLSAGSTTPKVLNLKGVHQPVGVAVDAKGQLYVSQAQDSTVMVFRPPYSAPVRTLRSGVSGPYFLALDQTGALFVPNANGATVGVYLTPGSAPHLNTSKALLVPVGSAAFSPAKS